MGEAERGGRRESGLAGRRQHAAPFIERLLDGEPGPARGNAVREGGDELAAGPLPHPDCHGEARGLQGGGAVAGHGGIGVAHANDDMRDSGGDERGRAGRRAAVVVAGFERDAEGAGLRQQVPLTQQGEQGGFGMRLARAAVGGEGKEIAGGIKRRRADGRIGRRGAQPATGFAHSGCHGLQQGGGRRERRLGHCGHQSA